MEEKNKIRGKKARLSGQRFELRVRKDLESKKWIVDKWSNNVQFSHLCELPARLVSAKHKFRGVGIPMSIGTGFPDFVAFMRLAILNDSLAYDVIGVECKSGKYLDSTEKTKCQWLLSNSIFSKILIASRGEKRGEINYKEFEK